MPKELMLFGYVGLCVVVALMGRKKTIGFWGFFFFSMILSPLFGLAILIIAKDREPKTA
jgi:hypothetical protein